MNRPETRAERSATRKAGTDRLHYHVFARRWWPAALLLFLLGPVLALAAYRSARTAEEQEVDARFAELVTRRADQLHGKLEAYVEALHWMRAYFYASAEVTRTEFAVFVRELLDRFPTIQAVEWIPRVTPEELDAHVEAARAEGLDTYRVRPIPSASGGRLPVADTPVHYPVLFVEPYLGNERALGIDLASERRRAETIERAVATGEVAFCDPIRLVQDPSASWGFLALLSVYERGIRVAEGTTAPVEGLVCVVFRAQDLVAAGQSSLLRYGVLVGREGGPRLVVEASDPTALAAAAEGEAPARERANVGGLDWTLLAWPTQAFETAHRRGHSLLWALVVLLGWEFLAGILMSLFRSAQDLAARRQADLVRSAFQDVGDGVVMVDREGTVRFANPAAERMVGSGLAGRAVSPWAAECGFHREGREAPLGPSEFPLTRALAGEAVAEETLWTHRPGSERAQYLSISATPLLDDGGARSGAITVMRNVTDQRALREREIEMQLAASVQQRLYPREAPALPGLDLSGAVAPAAATCGDYFDFVRTPTGSVVIGIGDVCGHGLGPAIVMAQTRAYVRSLIEAGHDLCDVLSMTNRYLCRDTADNLFVSLVLAEVEATGCHVRFANAGHPAGYLFSPDGHVRAELATTGPALGILPDATFSFGPPCTMAPDETLLLLTDGTQECRAPDGSILGSEGLLAMAREHLGPDARASVEGLQRAILDFHGGGPPDDDITLVVCRCESSAHPTGNAG